eukprot:207416_1
MFSSLSFRGAAELFEHERFSANASARCYKFNTSIPFVNLQAEDMSYESQSRQCLFIFFSFCVGIAHKMFSSLSFRGAAELFEHERFSANASTRCYKFNTSIPFVNLQAEDMSYESYHP